METATMMTETRAARYYYAVGYADGRGTTTEEHVRRSDGTYQSRITMAGEIRRFTTLRQAREWVAGDDLRDLYSSLTGWTRRYARRAIRDASYWMDDGHGGEVRMGRAE
jgi:hypothetical protein